MVVVMDRPNDCAEAMVFWKKMYVVGTGTST